MPSLALFLRGIRPINFTYREAAARTGLDAGHISDYEKGKRIPKPEQLVALAQAYGVDRHFVLLFADFLALPGFESLAGEPDEDVALSGLLQAATVDETRQLVKHLATMRFMTRMTNG